MGHKVHRVHNFRALSKPKHISKSEQRHYSPFLPLLFLVIGIFFVSLVSPAKKAGVLAYATEMSTSQLLSATNMQRQQNGAGSLAINNTLAQAAQTKANDMVARNYWSHNTPDGQEPWVFMDNAGYKYIKAGENLAYGFATSDDAVTGWMNSPTHRENLLDTAFTEVGFGFANSANFNNSGQETVVVAMYGKPQVLASQSTQPANPAPSNTPSNQPASQAASPVVTANSETTPLESVPVQPTTDQPVTTESTQLAEPKSQPITRAQTVTNGQAPWLVFGVGLVVGLSVMFLLAKHVALLRHVIKDGEQLVLHHPLLDLALVSLIIAGSFLSQTSGFIR